MDFDINNLMQQAQAMQEKMKKMQDEAANWKWWASPVRAW